ncbi:hypothetical protein LCGC14_1540930 [marine sediment metagenome]|uniref:Class I SAM-dependent methyltransferase n=2 Tax=root TaxID=1 RepID=A0A7V1CW85_9GAMM|nr:class I SAM-dependent methyltransferase [Pseudoalteromonas prydzensis]HEA15483.1 class I SAM-dependent methyltransferase [Pseudoalteromonas prydzensis]
MTTDSHQALKAYYQKLYQQHGDCHHAVQHVSKAAQNVRFKIFLEQIPLDSNVIDLGCGLGDMLAYFRLHGFTGGYLGYDFVPEFINSAKNKFVDDAKAQFEVFDIFKNSMSEQYDYILISGVFNNKLDDNLTFIMQTLDKSFLSCKKSVIFNALSSYVEYEDPTLFYINPINLFDECKQNLTPFIDLKHDYVIKKGGFPYEFTMKLSKEANL